MLVLGFFLYVVLDVFQLVLQFHLLAVHLVFSFGLFLTTLELELLLILLSLKPFLSSLSVKGHMCRLNTLLLLVLFLKACSQFHLSLQSDLRCVLISQLVFQTHLIRSQLFMELLVGQVDDLLMRCLLLDLGRKHCLLGNRVHIFLERYPTGNLGVKRRNGSSAHRDWRVDGSVKRTWHRRYTMHATVTLMFHSFWHI